MTTLFKMWQKEPFLIKKWPYLGKYWKSNKNKSTLLSPTLKVWENKVTLVFQNLAYKPRYGHFIIILCYQQCELLMLKNDIFFSLSEVPSLLRGSLCVLNKCVNFHGREPKNKKVTALPLQVILWHPQDKIMA